MSGHMLFVLPSPTAPQIPPELQRVCPQCTHTTWRLSRLCWHCGFEFAAPLSQCARLLAALVLINLLTLGAVLAPPFLAHLAR